MLMLTALKPGFSLALRQGFTMVAPAVHELRNQVSLLRVGSYRTPHKPGSNLGSDSLVSCSERECPIGYTIMKELG